MRTGRHADELDIDQMNGFLSLLRNGFRAGVALSLGAAVFVSAQPAGNASATASQGPETLQHLTLADAQRMAVKRNWDLLAAAAGVDASTAQRIVAHEFPNPGISFLSSKINTDNHPSGTTAGNGLWDRNYDTIFAVNQLFEIGGKRRSRQASAQAGYQGARAQWFDAKRILDLGVAKAYVTAALAEENAQVLKASAATLRQEATLADVRFRAGEISSADKSQIEITAERFELDARSAESTAAQGRIVLEVLLGVPRPNADCVLSDHLEALAELPLLTDTNSAGTLRPDVVAAQAALEKTEADLRLQKALRVPDPTVLAQYEHEPPDAPNTLGVGVSFPLPIWNRNRGNIRAAEAAREQARLALEKAKAQAVADIATSLLAYEDAMKRWRAFRESIRPKSEAVRKTKAYAYQKGGASLLDMLVAERDDNDVRLAALQAASDTALALATAKAATEEVRLSQITK
jgi:cobalt-zinc-cadmium efflux system outer membrane protein